MPIPVPSVAEWPRGLGVAHPHRRRVSHQLDAVPRFLGIAEPEPHHVLLVEGDQRGCGQGRPHRRDIAHRGDDIRGTVGAPVEQQRVADAPRSGRTDEPLILLDIEPSGSYFLSLFHDAGLEPLVGLRTKSLEMVRGYVGHGLGYSILAAKPANAMTYDGRALAARPLSGIVANSTLVLATLAGRNLSPMALEFAAHCRTFFGSAEI